MPIEIAPAAGAFLPPILPDLSPLIHGEELVGGQQMRLQQAIDADNTRNQIWNQRLQAAQQRQDERLDAQSGFIDQRFQNAQQLLTQQGQQQQNLWDYRYNKQDALKVAQYTKEANTLQQLYDNNAAIAQDPTAPYQVRQIAWQRAQELQKPLYQAKAKAGSIQPTPVQKPPPVDLDQVSSQGMFHYDDTGALVAGGLPRGVPGTVFTIENRNGSQRLVPHSVNLEGVEVMRETALKERAAEIENNRQIDTHVASIRSNMTNEIAKQREHALDFKQKLLLEETSSYEKAPDGKFVEKKVHTYTPEQAEAEMRKAYPGYPEFNDVSARYQSQIDEARGTKATVPPPGQPASAAPTAPGQAAPAIGGVAAQPIPNATPDMGGPAPIAAGPTAPPPAQPTTIGQAPAHKGMITWINPRTGAMDLTKPGEDAPSKDYLALPETQADYEALPKGARYKHPDGTIKIKK